MTHDHLKGAIALGIIIGKKESTERLEALATEIATSGTLTADAEASLALVSLRCPRSSISSPVYASIRP